MQSSDYFVLKRAVSAAGYADELAWAANIQPCASADDFAIEHAFVVCNSGMKAQIARGIFERVKAAILAGRAVRGVFRHAGKAGAIDAVWLDRTPLFDVYGTRANDKQRIDFLATLPWIGDITKWHLAKNLGIDCCKPDRHLVRIASLAKETPDVMCRRLSRETGDRVALVDNVIWRAANLGLLESPCAAGHLQRPRN